MKLTLERAKVHSANFNFLFFSCPVTSKDPMMLQGLPKDFFKRGPTKPTSLIEKMKKAQKKAAGRKKKKESEEALEQEESRSKLLAELNQYYVGRFDIPIGDMSPPTADTMNRDNYEGHVSYLENEMWLGGPTFSGKDAVVSSFEVKDEEKASLLREWVKFYQVSYLFLFISFISTGLQRTACSLRGRWSPYVHGRP